MLVAGKTNAEMAAALGLSVGTIKRYVSTVMIKWNCRNRTDVATEAIRRRAAVAPARGFCPTCGQPLPR